MPKNFYDYLFAANQKPESSQESFVQDEAIGEWTHKFVVYCKNPKKEFEEELKSKDGVVAVFMKAKESKTAPAETNPPNQQ